MATKSSTFTIGSTGNISVTGIPFPVQELTFYVAQKYGVAENTVSHLSVGFADGDAQFCHSILSGTSGNHTRSTFSNCITHYKVVSNVFTKAIEASFVSMDDNGGGDYGFTVNATTADANFQITYVARG